MRQKKKQMDKVAIALVLCFCVVAIASVFTVKSGIDKLNNLSKSQVEQSNQMETKDQDVVKPVPTVDSKDNNQTVPEKQASQFAAPLAGAIIVEYSKDVPIYSKTLDQYMIHEGIDIAADLDTQVQAVAAGTVTSIYTDDRYGVTIEINHGNGLCSLYSNLSTAMLVESGDVVKKGQVISGVGDTALFETLDATHLHFAMQKDGSSVNPTDYIAF